MFAKIGIVECMAFSSDGRVLGVSTADGALTMYDWQTGRALNVLRSAPARVLIPLICSGLHSLTSSSCIALPMQSVWLHRPVQADIIDLP